MSVGQRERGAAGAWGQRERRGSGSVGAAGAWGQWERGGSGSVGAVGAIGRRRWDKTLRDRSEPHVADNFQTFKNVLVHG